MQNYLKYLHLGFLSLYLHSVCNKDNIANVQETINNS